MRDTAAGMQVEVLRGGRFLTLPSTVLVPGDVIAVVTGVLPADCVLLTGECIVDENMLTGGAAHQQRCCYRTLCARLRLAFASFAWSRSPCPPP